MLQVILYHLTYCNRDRSFEIIPNLIVSPFGVIQNGVNGFDAIEPPARMRTFQIDNSTYLGIFATDSHYLTIVNITDPSSPSQVSVLDSADNSLFAITKVAYTVIDGSTYVISTVYLETMIVS